MSCETIKWKVTVRSKDAGETVSFVISAPSDATENQLRDEARKILNIFADRQRARDDMIVHILELILQRRQRHSSESVEEFLEFFSTHLSILSAVSEFVKRTDSEACVYEFVPHTAREAQEKHVAT